MIITRTEALRMTIFWDWNGTLLDDVAMAVELTNDVFRQYGFRQLTMEAYLDAFRFPIIDYYEERGVPRERFPEIAHAWMARYTEAFPTCPLMDDAVATVRRFQAAGFRQIILSATRLDMLHEQVGSHRVLDGMFDRLLGIGDIYAGSKVHIARAFMADDGLCPADAVLLGDTCHDAEVADDIGCRCLLIARGHQSEKQLAAAGKPVLSSLTAAAELLLNQ